MGSLVRDNKIILKKLVNSYNFKDTYMRCDLNLCRVGVTVDGFYTISYLPVFKVDSDAIAFVEDRDDIYVCVDLDKVCTENNLRLCKDLIDSLNSSKYMYLDEGFKDLFAQYNSIIRDSIYLNSFREIDADIVKFMHRTYPDLFDLLTLKTTDGFTKAVQFIKDNSLQDTFFEYIREFMRERFSKAVHDMLSGGKTFSMTKDAYFKNNKIAFARMNFKDMILYVYNGNYFNKVSLSNRSSHVVLYDIDNIIKRTSTTARLMFGGVQGLFPDCGYGVV